MGRVATSTQAPQSVTTQVGVVAGGTEHTVFHLQATVFANPAEDAVKSVFVRHTVLTKVWVAAGHVVGLVAAGHCPSQEFTQAPVAEQTVPEAHVQTGVGVIDTHVPLEQIWVLEQAGVHPVVPGVTVDPVVPGVTVVGH